MRYTVIDAERTVSFVAPWNSLKALVAGCSRKPSPASLTSLLEAASNYDTTLKSYVLDGLKTFEVSFNAGEQQHKTELSPRLEQELRRLLSGQEATAEQKTTNKPPDEAQNRAIDPELAHLPVFQVVDEVTRHQSLEPVTIGLVIFNLPAKRIIQIQNTLGVLQRSDRGRYFENGEPTERLYFYRLPDDWAMVP